jgi:polyhydroxyalkanoate synthesis regulator protein
MLPISFLRQLISMYGNSMQALMPHYLEASMENFQANQRKLQDIFKQSMGSDAFAKMAETNMAMFKAAASAFMPKGQGGDEGDAPAPKAKDDELSVLKAQMAEMQRKLDSLGD